VAGLTRFLVCLLVVAAVATIGGALFAVVHGGVTMTRSIAYAFWIAGALALLGIAGAVSRLVARRLDLQVIEGWIFVVASSVLIGIGMVVDVLGS
jgi:hypothetical protein